MHNVRLLLRTMKTDRPDAVCGVYAIRNRDSGRAYIGSSINMRVRLDQHRSSLKSGGHRNTMLQADWTAHPHAFEFGALLECSPEDRATIEKELISQIIGAESYNWSESGQRHHRQPCNYEVNAARTARRMDRLRMDFLAWAKASNISGDAIDSCWLAWHDAAFAEANRIASLADSSALDEDEDSDALFSVAYTALYG